LSRVLVTGGAGFIGSHLVEALVKQGNSVRVLDNLSSGKRSNLETVMDQIEIHEGDIRNTENLRSAIAGVDTIFHEAAMVSVPESIEDPKKCFESNIQAVVDLLDISRENKVSKVIMASSTAVYGAQEKMPLHEEMATQTLSPYAASKLYNESLAAIYADNDGMRTVALRYFNVYGPRQLPESDYAAVIPKFVNSLQQGQAPTVFGDGEQTRDFVYVADIVRANLLAAEKTEAAGKVFNVCSGVETSLLDLLDLLVKSFPNAPKPNFEDSRLGDVPRSSGDPTLAAEVLDFRASTSLEDGLQSLIGAKR
jgi:nucleoside-diphosphate-sugar epimerase